MRTIHLTMLKEALLGPKNQLFDNKTTPIDFIPADTAHQSQGSFGQVSADGGEACTATSSLLIP